MLTDIRWQLPTLATLLILLASSHALASETAEDEITTGEAPPLEITSEGTGHHVGAAAGKRFSAGVPVEVNIVGFALGVRPELLYRPFDPGGGTHLRFAVGVLPGFEFVFVPINVGWRHIYRREHRVQPNFGAGFEQQFFLISGEDTIHRPSFYLEGGFDVRLSSSAHLGFQIATDLALFRRPGFGLAPRVTTRWDF